MTDTTPIAPRGQIGTTFDLAWPPVYGLFALSAWAFALERLGPRVATLRGLARIVLLGPGFDFAENIAATVGFHRRGNRRGCHSARGSYTVMSSVLTPSAC